jgi:hypothetical protein
MNINRAFISCLFFVYSFGFSIAQGPQNSKILLCTKVKINISEQETFFVKLKKAFQDSIYSDLAIKKIKFLSVGYISDLHLYLYTPVKYSIDRLANDLDTNFRFIVFELDSTNFVLSQNCVDALQIRYDIIQKNYTLKIENNEICKKIKRRDWKKVIIEMRFFKEENIYKYARYNMPFSS